MKELSPHKIKTDLSPEDCMRFYKTMCGSHERLPDVCESCVLQRGLSKHPPAISPEEVFAYQEEFRAILAAHADSCCAPEINVFLDDMRAKRFGSDLEGITDYSAIKRHFNALMLRFLPDAEKDVLTAPDPFLRAAQYALCGNIIDFAAPAKVDDDAVSHILSGVTNITLDEQVLSDLKEAAAKARRIVYLTDNCGEIVLDRLLIRQLKALAGPDADVCVIVRGAPAVNDATLEDAAQSGMDREARVIGNGHAVGGTSVPQMDAVSRETLFTADLILSKGMGNFETLIESGLDIFHLFLCKCDLFINFFQARKNEALLVHQRGGTPA